MRADNLFVPPPGPTGTAARTMGAAMVMPGDRTAMDSAMGDFQRILTGQEEATRTTSPSMKASPVPDARASDESDRTDKVPPSDVPLDTTPLPEPVPVPKNKAWVEDFTGPQILPGETPEIERVDPDAESPKPVPDLHTDRAPWVLPGETSVTVAKPVPAHPGLDRPHVLPGTEPPLARMTSTTPPDTDAAPPRVDIPGSQPSSLQSQPSPPMAQAAGLAGLQPLPAALQRLMDVRQAPASTGEAASRSPKAAEAAATSSRPTMAGPSPLPAQDQSQPAIPPVPFTAGDPRSEDPETPSPPMPPTAMPARTPEALADTSQGLALAPSRLPSALSRATVETTAMIAAQVLRRLDGRTTRFEMALTPESLGRVDVSLEIDSEGRMAARLAFDNPAAAAELRGRADELRRQLEQAGLFLAEDALQFSDRETASRDQRRDDSHGLSDRAFSRSSALAEQADRQATDAPAWRVLNLTPDRVDLKV